MVSLSPPVCDFGRPAIDFDLPGVDGRRHTLASARGSKGLLVMFICNHCPYVKAVLDRIIRDARELAALGVGSIAIMSNDPATTPKIPGTTWSKAGARLDFPFPYVLDESQAGGQGLWRGLHSRTFSATTRPWNCSIAAAWTNRARRRHRPTAGASCSRPCVRRRDRAGPAPADAGHRLFDQVARGVKAFAALLALCLVAWRIRACRGGEQQLLIQTAAGRRLPRLARRGRSRCSTMRR
jgi:hypothetical protein